MILADKVNNFFKSNSKFIISHLSYIVCIFTSVVIFIVSIFSYVSMNKQSVETYYYFSLNQLDRVRSYGDSQHTALQNLCLQTAFDSRIRKISYTDFDVMESYALTQTLKNYASFVPSVESLNVYDSKNKILYSSMDIPTFNVNDFPLDEIQNGVAYTFKQTLIHPQGLSKYESVILYSYTMENPDYLVFVTVSPWLMHFEDYHDKNVELYVTDENSKIIYSGANFEFNSTLPKEYRNISDVTKSYKIARIHGTKYMTISRQSQTTGYKYTYLIPYNIVTKNAVSQRAYYIIILICLFVLVVLISIFSFSKINVLIRQIQKKSIMYDTYSYNEKIKKCQDDLLTYLSAQFPNNNTSMAAYEHLKQYIDESGDRFILLSFDTDNFGKLESSGDSDLTQYGIANICLEITEKYFKALCIQDTSSTVTLIIADNGNISLSDLQTCASECMELVLKYLETGLTASIVTGSDFEHLYSAYETLKKTRQYRYIYGYNAIMTSNDIKPINSKLGNSPLFFKNLKSLFDKGDYINVKNTFKDFIFSLKALSLERAHLFIMQFVTFLSEYIDELNESHRLAENIDTIYMLEQITSSETLDGIYDYVSSLIDNISDTYIKKENNKYKKLIDKVSEIIDTNFSDSAFCPDDIANKVGLSTVYLNRIYKRETDSSLSSVILETRLTHAAEQIVSSSHSIKAIARKSGFINDSYFIVLFKKRFGCTPAVYKEEHEQKIGGGRKKAQIKSK